MNNFSVSIVDYIGELFGGVGIILSMNINDNIYEFVYWFNPSGDYRVVMNENFYDDFRHIQNIYEYKYLKDLIVYLHGKVLPSKEDCFKEFGII